MWRACWNIFLVFCPGKSCVEAQVINIGHVIATTTWDIMGLAMILKLPFFNLLPLSNLVTLHM
jgi:hypothetical protein